MVSSALYDEIAYLKSVDNKHRRQFFKVIMALLMKLYNNETNYIGWSGVALNQSVTLLVYAHVHSFKIPENQTWRITSSPCNRLQ